MDFKQLHQFVTLSETLNFRRAAQRLNIAQPALSVSLRRLESEFGVPLFDRGRHGVALTNAGEAALPEARRALDSAIRIRDRARAGAEGQVGTVRLGFVGTASYHLLPRALAAFAKAFPGVAVELQERLTAELLAGLLKETFDTVIVRYPLDVPPDLILQRLEVDRVAVALPAGHRLANRKSVALAELADDPFVVPSMTLTPSPFKATMAQFACSGFTPRIVQEASQIQTIIGLVQGGVGVALVPSCVGRNAWQGIKILPLTAPNDLPIGGMALLHRAAGGTRLARHLQCVLAGMADRMAAVPSTGLEAA